MAVKTANLTLTGGPMRFEVALGSGHSMVFDDGDGDTGVRPAEVVVAALAGCTGMDVISILRKKRQEVTAYTIESWGSQMEEHPHAYTEMTVTHVVQGPAIDVEAVRRAIELSATKYCSVGSTISSGSTTVHHGYRVLAADGSVVAEAHVLQTGPHEEPAALAARESAVPA